MPGPSSGCFVMTRSVRQDKMVKVASTRGLGPLSFVSSSQKGLQMPWHFSYASLPIFTLQSPCSTWLLLRCLINGILQLVTECFYFVLFTVWRWGVRLYYFDIERNCHQANNDEPARDWAAFHLCWPCQRNHPLIIADIFFCLFYPCGKRGELRRQRFEPEGPEKHRDVNNLVY